MDLLINPGTPLRGEVRLPGDKSLSHRAALFAALAEGTSRVDNFLVAGVTDVMLQALAALGVSFSLEGTVLKVHGRGLSGLTPSASPLDCGHSGTTIRFLAGALAAAGLPAVLDGSTGLRRRPMARVIEPIRLMGAAISATPEGTAPLVLEARPAASKLRGMEYMLPVASAQVKTAILLAGLAADGPVTLVEPGPSRDHTERLLASMGADVQTDHPGLPGKYAAVTLCPPETSLRPLNLRLPGDFSSAAFLIVAGLITPGSEITIRGVGLNPTRTGLLDVLRTMDASIELENQGLQGGEPVGDLKIRHSRLQSAGIAGELVVRMIDEFPAFAVAAAFADGTSAVHEAQELRLKESDRIGALCQELQGLGARIIEQQDGFTVDGSDQIAGGRVTPHRDHRLGMALAVAGLAARSPVMVENAGIIAESFPNFIETLRGLGADLQVTGHGP